jgi:hypothetical protein
MRSREFILAGDQLIPLDAVSQVDLSEIQQLRLSIRHGERVTIASGVQAIEIIMRLKPSALEGRRFRWQRHMWAMHNLLGHPLMQVLAFLCLHRWAIRVHDATVPRPISSA